MKQTVPSQEKLQTSRTTPFPERLSSEKKNILEILPEFDTIDELRNITIKIPFLREIKDIPIYSKTIRELYTRIFWKNKTRSTNNTSHR